MVGEEAITGEEAQLILAIKANNNILMDSVHKLTVALRMVEDKTRTEVDIDKTKMQDRIGSTTTTNIHSQMKASTKDSLNNRSIHLGQVNNILTSMRARGAFKAANGILDQKIESLSEQIRGKTMTSTMEDMKTEVILPCGTTTFLKARNSSCLAGSLRGLRNLIKAKLRLLMKIILRWNPYKTSLEMP